MNNDEKGEKAWLSFKELAPRRGSHHLASLRGIRIQVRLRRLEDLAPVLDQLPQSEYVDPIPTPIIYDIIGDRDIHLLNIYLVGVYLYKLYNDYISI